MNRLLCRIAFLAIFSLTIKALAQQDSVSIFGPTAPLRMEMSFNYSQLIKNKFDDEYQPAILTVHLDDSTQVADTIRIKARGEFRREYCKFPPLALNFKKADFGYLPLNELERVKLVTTCRLQEAYQQYLYEEYLAYRIYNLLTPMSYQVRLVEITYRDNQGKKDPFTEYGFIIEETDKMAARNQCVELEAKSAPEKQLNRAQMTLVAVFEFMIGNTDWYTGNLHNIRVIQPLDVDNVTSIYPVPYDFDYSGLVNAMYAAPDPKLGIESVRDRYYLGACRTRAELEVVFDIMRLRRREIEALYRDFPLLTKENRQIELEYLADFYEIINNPSLVEQTFMNNCK
ncbi:MAG: hypothetical protein SF053_21500 [Bacteroidia bacterium]|nr:hypothetical protein [Bacteroidia bacterium]